MVNDNIDVFEPLIDDLMMNATKVHKGYLMKKSGGLFGRDQLRFFELFSDGRIKYSAVTKKGYLDYRGQAFLTGDTDIIRPTKKENTIEFKSAKKDRANYVLSSLTAAEAKKQLVKDYEEEDVSDI